MARVSLLMTIYNAAPFLPAAIDSLLAQGFADWTLIAVENGSADESPQILASYDDPRIRTITLPSNIGRTPALRVALDAADSEYAAVLDADDYCRPDRLERQVAYLDGHPDVVLVGTSWQELLPDGHLVDAPPLPGDHAGLIDAMAAGNPIAHSSVMYRRVAAVAAGNYPPDFIFAQDLALYHRLSRHGKLALLPEPLVTIRLHQGQMTCRPDQALIRVDETERLLANIQAWPGLSAKARRAGRRALAGLRVQRGTALWRSGRRMAALAAWTAALGTDPAACCVGGVQRLAGIFR